MTTTTLFKSNQTQAVRFPKDVAFPESVKEVSIVKQGKSRLVSPLGSGWDAFFFNKEWDDAETLIHRDEQIPSNRENLC